MFCCIITKAAVYYNLIQCAVINPQTAIGWNMHEVANATDVATSNGDGCGHCMAAVCGGGLAGGSVAAYAKEK